MLNKFARALLKPFCAWVFSCVCLGLSLTSAYASQQYYVLSENQQRSDLAIISLADDNTVSVGDWSATLQENELATIPASYLSLGSQVTGTGAFDVASQGDATDMLVPSQYAATEFVVPHTRQGHVYYALSPEQDATLTLTIGNEVTEYALIAGQVMQIGAGDNNTVSALISTDVPVLVAHIGHGTASNIQTLDAFPVVPPSTQLWGINSGKVVLGALQNNTQVTVYESGGASAEYVLNAGSRQVVELGSNSPNGQGTSYHIVANQPVMAVQYLDGDDASIFSSTAQLNNHYGLPVTSDYVAITCIHPNTFIRLSNPNNNDTPMTQVCHGDANGVPGKAYFATGSSMVAGHIIHSNYPTHLYYQASETQDENSVQGQSLDEGLPAPVLTTNITETEQNTLPIQGMAEPGSDVALYVNNSLDDQAIADEQGRVALEANLSDGHNTLHAIASKQGDKSDSSNQLTIYHQTPEKTTQLKSFAQPIAESSAPITAKSLSGNTLTGTISTNTTLQSGQTYQVDSTTTVNSGVTLTIQSGARLEFALNAKLIVNGELQVWGRADRKVVFTSQRANPAPGNWRGVELNNTAKPYNWRHLIVEYAITGIKVNENVTLNLVDSELRYNSTGLHFDAGSKGSAERNRVLGNRIYGVNIGAASTLTTSPLISNNIIDGLTTTGLGIFIRGRSYSKILGNTITRLNGGMSLQGFQNAGLFYTPNPTITGNSIYSNATNITTHTFNPNTNQRTVLNAQDNWWGTANITEIFESISDYNDNNVSAPHVDYRGFLDGAPPYGRPVPGNQLISFVEDNQVLEEDVEYQALGHIHVRAGTKLIIREGAKIAFAKGAKLIGDGEIQINSDANRKPVTFTSQARRAGFDEWFGIELANTDKLFFWRNVIVEYAQVGISVAEQANLSLFDSLLHHNKTALHFDEGAKGKVERNRFFSNTQYGIQLGVRSSPVLASTLPTSPNILNNVIQGNGLNGTGIYIFGDSNAEISGNTITRLSRGLEAAGLQKSGYHLPSPKVSANSIHSNLNANYFTSTFDPNTNQVTILDATGNWWGTTQIGEIAGGIRDYIDAPLNSPHVNFSGFLDAPPPEGQPIPVVNQLNGVITSNTELEAGKTYTVTNQLVVPVNRRLVIPQGVILRFEKEAGILVQGTLLVQGTASKPVTLSSINSMPVAKDWRGIVIQGDQANVEINYALIEYADKALLFDNASGNVRNSVIQHSDRGIEIIQSASPVITQNLITQNRHGIYITGTNNDATNPQPVINRNDIYGNIASDLYIERFGINSQIQINVRNNWWGGGSPNSTVLGSPTNIIDDSAALSNPFLGSTVHSVALDKQFIAPGKFVKLSAQANEPLSWVISVVNGNGNTVRQYQRSGDSINVFWNGQNASSQAVSDGVYTFKIRTQLNGKTIQAGTVSVVVDGTSPSANINDWQDGRVIKNAVDLELQGTAQDTNLSHYVLEYSSTASPNTWVKIQADQFGRIVNGPLGFWQVGLLDGAATPIKRGQYNVRLTVKDKAGNQATDSIRMTVDNLNISNVTTSKKTINPVRNETTSVRFLLNNTSRTKVELKIYPAEQGTLGSPMRTITRFYDVAGSYEISWDGRSKGMVVNPSMYLFTLTATDANGGVAHYDPYESMPPQQIGLSTNDYISKDLDTFENKPVEVNVELSHAAYLTPIYRLPHRAAFRQKSRWVEAGDYSFFWNGIIPESNQLIQDVYVGNFINLELRPVSDNYLIIKGDEPEIKGPQSLAGLSPQLTIQTNPYLFFLSYGQTTRFQYHLDRPATVTIKLMAPGVTRFSDPRNITVLFNKQLAAGDHSVDWQANSLLSKINEIIKQDGAYVFAIKAVSDSGAETIEQGVLNVFQ